MEKFKVILPAVSNIAAALTIAQALFDNAQIRFVWGGVSFTREGGEVFDRTQAALVKQEWERHNPQGKFEITDFNEEVTFTF